MGQNPGTAGMRLPSLLHFGKYIIMVYNRFSDYLKNKYGSKVYKLPLNLCTTCPNRNGGTGGCIFCGDEGADFEMLSPEMSITEQLESNRRYIGEKYKAEKFIAYFQNYSNTYLPPDAFGKAMTEACAESVVALYISTRPDCIDEARTDFLRQLKEERGIDIVVELGLQSVNTATLRWLKRGHGLAEFVDAVLRLKKSGLEICAHMINDLPSDDAADVIEGAKLLSALQIDQVKCHSLYILENTELGELYKKGSFRPLEMDEFIERTILFLEYLSPEIVVQRLIGRAPADRTLFCSWNTSWRRIHDMIVERMQTEGRYQGRHYDYLNGSALKGLDN
jgi:radical SAM protein (TIGR01212 family)